jgi:hypothetical protein
MNENTAKFMLENANTEILFSLKNENTANFYA